jgi:hypothetical protein
MRLANRPIIVSSILSYPWFSRFWRFYNFSLYKLIYRRFYSRAFSRGNFSRRRLNFRTGFSREYRRLKRDWKDNELIYNKYKR